MEKKRVIISLNNLPPGVLEALRTKYPLGYNNFVKKVKTGNESFFYGITVDTDDASYLIKVPVKIDQKGGKEDEDIFADNNSTKESEENNEEEEPEVDKEE